MLDENTIALVGPLAVGAALLLAGASKLRHSERLREVLTDSYEVGSAQIAAAIALVLPVTEIALGFLLLSGFYVRVVSLAAALLLLSITAMVVSRLKDRSECGCGLEMLGRSRSAIAIRNLALVFLLLPAILWAPGSPNSVSGIERFVVSLMLASFLVSILFGTTSPSAAGTALSRRSFLRVAMASAVALVPGLYSTRNAEAACYGCETCSPQSILLNCSEVCCTFLVRDREYCDTGCTPCSGWREEVHCG